MNRKKINRISAVTPIVMSLMALGLVVTTVTTGWERVLKDEGAGAHIFQLLIVLQVPFLVAFVATAEWNRFMRVAWLAGLQIAALGVAIGSVAYFKL